MSGDATKTKTKLHFSLWLLVYEEKSELLVWITVVAMETNLSLYVYLEIMLSVLAYSNLD